MPDALPRFPRPLPCLALALLVAACGTGPATPAPGSASGLPGGGNTLMSYACAIPYDFVATDTVTITDGVYSPMCVFAPPGTSVRFVNRDPREYIFQSNAGQAFDLVVPANGSAATLPLDQGVAFTSFQLSSTVVVLVRWPNPGG